MADIKESALTQKNDCKWVRALDENGNSIRISKEDLAAVVGELLPEATKDKNGLLPKQRASFTINFSSSDIVLNFKSIYNFHPFFIICYYNGSYGTYYVNPSAYQDLTDIKVRYLGLPECISVYAKPNDSRIFIRTVGSSNGRLSFQFMYEYQGSLLNVEKCTIPEDFTKIDAKEM